MPKQESIRNILFDLGGVILDIDVGATLNRFLDLGFPPSLLHYPMNMQTDIFFRYETGRIDTETFRDELRKASGKKIPDEELDEAWNAMIVGIPAKRTRLINRLSEKYSLYMLSNTSPLHAPVFEKMYDDVSGIPMRKVFKDIYYSYQTGWHKPDPGAWEYVIGSAGIIPSETIFLDDNIHNIKASQELGFRAIHIHERTDLLMLGFDL